MKKFLAVAALVGFVGAAVAVAEDQPAAAPAEKPAPKTGCFVCGKCKMVMTKAGKCCGQEAKACHRLAIKDGQCVGCACPEDCKCTIKADDPTKCSCGKDVVKHDLKGKFVCEKCLVAADQAGKCPKCGADLVEVKAPAAAEAPAAEAPAAAPAAEAPAAEAPAAK